MRLGLFCPLSFLVAGLLLPEPAGAQQKQSDSSTVTYIGQVRQILSQNCYRCHSDEEPKAGLFLDTFEDIFRGGEHGTAVRPGKPDSSILYLKLLPEPPFGRRMPARRSTPLSDADIETIRLWILQGAMQGRTTSVRPPLD